MSRFKNQMKLLKRKKKTLSQVKSGNHNNIVDRTAEQSIFFIYCRSNYLTVDVVNFFPPMLAE